MSIRTQEDLVRAIISNSAGIDTTPFIRAASLLVDKLDVYDTAGVHSVADLKEIETWLAAHFYGLRDAQYQSKSTGGASATFQGQTGLCLDLTWWGQTAKILDTTGYLAKLDQEAKGGKRVASMQWLGTTAPGDER